MFNIDPQGFISEGSDRTPEKVTHGDGRGKLSQNSTPENFQEEIFMPEGNCHEIAHRRIFFHKCS